MRPYRIRSGCRFRTAEGQVKGEGDVIELHYDVAAMHADKVEPAADLPADAVPAEPQEERAGQAEGAP